MGKKGKGKAKKETGTPDVVKFKGQREFHLLKECVSIQESLPFVASDILDDFSFKKVARFLNMVGLLTEFSLIETNKAYRFMYHHAFLAPVPQFFPNGYDAEIIKAARKIMERPVVTFNSREYQFPEEIRNHADRFLKDVDSYMTKIASFIEPCLKDDFASGLKKFRWDLKDLLKAFDAMWCEFEREYLKALHVIHTEVFAQIEKLVSIETKLTQSEEKHDIEMKQRLENELVEAMQEFVNVLFPDTAERRFPEDVIPLAEACVFYETKCTEEWLNLAKHLIKDYLEVRIYITNIPVTRIHPQHHENTQFVRLLKTFHKSVTEAYEALEFVSKLPKLIHAKTSNWMTRRLLEPDLMYIHQQAHAALAEGSPAA